MDFEKLLKEHHIDYSTEHKNVRDGWIGVDCPWCGTRDKYHLGYAKDDDYFSCWQCGGHSHTSVVSKLLRVSTLKAEDIVERYGGVVQNKGREPIVKAGTNEFKMPVTVPHNSRSWTYLYDRGFDDPDELIETWDIRYTGPMSKMDGIKYSNRILAPIYWDQDIVSFQTRDITERSSAKYITCSPEREKIHHKSILYMNPKIKFENSIFICEGIFDVWKLGIQAVATFGVKYTETQAIVLSSLFNRAVIVYDPERKAQRIASRLKKELIGYGMEKVTIAKLPCDPGDLTEEEVSKFKKKYSNY